MAPELFEGPAIDGSGCSFKSDIWSLGVLLWEILTGHQPYKGLEHLAICVQVSINGSKLPIPDTTPDCFKKVLNNLCWAKDPNKRANIETIVDTIEKSEGNDFSQ